MKHDYRIYKELGIDKINELFRYDEKTGLLCNIITRHYRAKKDEIAGGINKSNYRIVRVNNKLYYQHILIWMITHNGNIPKNEIDHINRDCSDNRIINLRDINHKNNQYNRPVYGTSKFRGVYWHKKEHKWRSQIKINNKIKNIGSFKNEIDAAKAYDGVARNAGREERLMNFPQCSGCLISLDV